MFDRRRRTNFWLQRARRAPDGSLLVGSSTVAALTRTSRLLIGVAIAVALLATAEVLLRLTVPDAAPRLVSPLSFQRNDQPIATPGPTAGSVVFGGPSIAASKDPVGRRVFFFGGSATQGYHMTPYSSFAGWYQRFMRRAEPATPLEVINLGAGGEASRQVADLMAATAGKQHADLFVVYSGNNEYYELRALKEAIPGFDARAELARRRLSGLHVYRTLRRLLLPVAPLLDGDADLRPVDSIDAEIDHDERELGVLLYAEHLRSMVESATGAKVPLLLATVADHTRSYAFHGEPPALSDGVEAGVRALDRAGRSRDAAAIRTAVDAVRSRLKTQADHHAVARLLDRDQQWALAKPLYETAEYLDPRPRRSSEPMRDALRSVAADTSTPLCDVSAELARVARGGIIGDEFFFDPCHPNPLGHRRIAEILVRCTLEQGLLTGDAQAVERSIATTPLAGTDPTRLDHYTVRRAQLHENRAMNAAEIDAAIRAFDDGTAEGAAAAGHQAVLFRLYQGALAWYDLAESRGGSSAGLWVSRGLVQQHLHDIQSARRALDAALQLEPNDTEIRQFRAVLGDG